MQNMCSLFSLGATCSSATSCFARSLRQAAWLQCLSSALISSLGEQWQVGAPRTSRLCTYDSGTVYLTKSQRCRTRAWRRSSDPAARQNCGGAWRGARPAAFGAG